MQIDLKMFKGQIILFLGLASVLLVLTSEQIDDDEDVDEGQDEERGRGR